MVLLVVNIWVVIKIVFILLLSEHDYYVKTLLVANVLSNSQDD